MKRFLAILLALVMLLGTAANAFALAPVNTEHYDIYLYGENVFTDDISVTYPSGTYYRYDIHLSDLPAGWLVSSYQFFLTWDDTKLVYAANSKDFGMKYLYYNTTNALTGTTTKMYVDFTAKSYTDQGRFQAALASENGCYLEGDVLLSVYFILGAAATADEAIPVTFSLNLNSPAVGTQITFVQDNTAQTAIPTESFTQGDYSGSVTPGSNPNWVISYVADGETVATYEVAKSGTLATIPAVPAKEGYDKTAPYWDTDLNGVTITRNYTINAVYTINTYFVKYLADGVTVANYTVNWGETVPSIPAVPAKTGYDQVAPVWGTSLSGVLIKQDYTVNAIYTANLYTVVYRINGTAVITYEQIAYGTYLQQAQIPAIPAKTGYDAVSPRWSVDLNGVAIKQNYTIDAIYTINTYTVTYLADGVQVAAYTVDWNTKLAAIPAVPAKTGCDKTAPYWDTALGNVAITQDYTVNAVYTINLYTVVYMVDDEPVKTYTDVPHGSFLTDIPVVPPKDNLIASWSADYTKTAVTADDVVMPVYRSPFKYGDVNLDGSVTSADAAYLLRIVAALDKLYADERAYNQRLASDVTFDNALSAADATKILRFVVHLVATLDPQPE